MAGIWASRGVDGEEEEEEKEEGGEISPMFESIGHRPLRGRCPKRSGFQHKLDTLVLLEIDIVNKL